MTEYNKDFYSAYERYLKSGLVRQSHDNMFKLASSIGNFKNVVDLGCGQYKEFLQHSCHIENYVGIDENAIGPNDIKANYRSFDLSVLNFKPTSFVSLFSTEITAPYRENYILYNKIFNDIPSIQYGLVSGFYYYDQKNINPIIEFGGLKSYQTLENLEEVESNIFKEIRVVLPVPSEMFGATVHEVWKVFIRNYPSNL